MKYIINLAVLVLITVAVMNSSHAQPREDVLRLQKDAPREYVVQRGDTLWDISALFLEDPWRWPELWQNNEEVANPHLIYPGDKLYLSWRDGRPVLTRKVSKTLQPDGRVQSKSKQPLQMFSHSMLAPFLSYHRLVDITEVDGAPQIIGDNSAAPRLSGMAPVFIEHNNPVENRRYGVFTHIETLDDTVLLRHIADVKVTGGKDGLYQGELSNLQREVRRGDVLLPLGEAEYPLNYQPQDGVEGLVGTLATSLNRQQQQGRFDIVVLDQGRDDGVVVGQMYQAIRPGVELLMDYERPIVKADADKWQLLTAFASREVQLPEAATAELMVVQVEAQASFAIVLRTHDWLRVGDAFVPMFLTQ